MKRTWLLGAILTIYLASTLFSKICPAQDYVYAAGNPTFSTTIPIENGFINVSNGNVHLEIPLATHPQRGALKLNERLVYDSRVWKIVNNGSYSWQPVNIPNSMGGWRFTTGLETGAASDFAAGQQASGTVTCQVHHFFVQDFQETWTVFSQFQWTDPQGAVHLFNVQTQEPDQVCNSDTSHTIPSASGYAVDGSGYQVEVSNYESMTVIDKNGNEVYPQVIDRYGNYWSKDGNGNLVDDRGLTPVLVSSLGNQTFYDVLTTGGARSRYTVTMTQVNVNTLFSEQAVHEFSGSFTAIQSIQLPDGSSYGFTYGSGTGQGSYGELLSMKVPTGSIINFGYGKFYDSYQNSNLWITSYTGGKGQYSFSPAVVTQCSGSLKVGCHERVIVTSPSEDPANPSSNDRYYDLTLNNGAWNTRTDVYAGPVGTGKPALLTTSTSYDFSHSCDPTICNGAQYIQKQIQNVTLIDTGVTSQTQSVFNNPQLGKITALKEWDFYTGSPSATPSRETDYSYTGYDLTQQTTLNSQAQQVAQATYNFTTGATATSGLPQHGGTNAGGPYLQSVVQWLNLPSPTTVTTSYAYDDAGTLLSVTDPNRNPATTFGHDATDTFVTSTVPPTTNGVSHASSAQFDSSSGKITQSIGENASDVTNYSYNSLGRLQTVSHPSDSAQTTYTYPSASEVDTSVQQSATASVVSTSVLDGFGREYFTSSGGTSVLKSFDANGRLVILNNPKVGAEVEPTDGRTTFAYDPLGRVVKQTQPDNYSQQWQYTGNAVLQTDEAGHKRRQVTDAFGRLTAVFEPDGNNNPTLETDYQYDALSNMTSIVQKGVAGETARTRSFVYDSLGRLTSDSAPESGTTSYSYDPNGNLNTQRDANGTVRNYGYDALNRVAGASGSDGSFGYNYYYDSNGHASSIGRLVHASNNVNSAANPTYDAAGRVIDQAQCLPSDCSYGVSYSAQYDYAGNLTQLTYPDGRVIQNQYDTSGHLVNVAFTSWQGQSVNYNYLNLSAFTPSGSWLRGTFGNGVQISNVFDSRLRPAVMSLNETRGGNQAIYSKTYQYTPASDVQGISDALSSPQSLIYGYDNLHRITSSHTSDNAYSQTFGYDSFGDLQQSGSSTFQTAYSPANRIQASGYVYDAAGRLTQSGPSTQGGHTFAYNANGVVTQVDSGAARYTYDALGHRVRKDANGDWTEYVYFGDDVIAEKHSDGSWSDYIYANGQRIARANSYDQRYHMSGTNLANTDARSSFARIPYAGSRTIQNGDVLHFRQYQIGAACGGLAVNFTDGSNANLAKDQDGQLIVRDATLNQWHLRAVDLSAFAGKTLANVNLLNAICAPNGHFDLYFGDISVTGSDGSVFAIFDNQPGIVLYPTAYYDASEISGLTAVDERSNTAGDAMEPQITTTYYHGDHLGSARLLTAAGGWPVYADTFYAYGQEPAASSDPNHFKFTGQERDVESNLDYFKARYYGSTMGRFTSPDPYLGSMDLSNPQSFNRYSYVGGRPLVFTDPTGEEACTTAIALGAVAGNAPGVVIGGVACFAELLGSILGLGHLFDALFGPTFNGSLQPRPESTGKPDWANADGSFGESLGVPKSIPHGSWSIVQTLGLPGNECEFGACGDITSSFQQGAAAAPIGWCAQHPTICTAGVDAAAFLRAIPAVAASTLLLNMEGDNKRSPSGADALECAAEWKQARDYCSSLMSDPRRAPNVWGGSFDRCVRGQVSQRCGGNRVH